MGHRFCIVLAASVVTALAWVAPASAQDGLERLELCMSCHGETGNPSMKGVPSLAGRPASELSRQLGLFRSGERNHAQMIIAKGLSDAEIEAVSLYFSSQKGPE